MSVMSGLLVCRSADLGTVAGMPKASGYKEDSFRIDIILLKMKSVFSSDF